MEIKVGVGKELPFTHSLQEIARDVFIAAGDSAEDQVRKKLGGFYAIEKRNGEIDRLEKISGSYLTAGWIKDQYNFHNLLQVVAKNSSILERSTLDERDLRSAFYMGAQAELSDYRNYIANNAIYGQATIRGLDILPSIPEAQARITGLERFQQKLLERTSPAVKPQS